MADSKVAVVILVAEDDSVSRAVLAESLHDAGYEVIEAADGHEAMAKLEERGKTLSGLVTDIRMGDGPDGWHVARHARELNPFLPIVYMSGDSAADWNALGVPHSVIVQKPFAPSQIVVALGTLATRSDAAI